MLGIIIIMGMIGDYSHYSWQYDVSSPWVNDSADWTYGLWLQ